MLLNNISLPKKKKSNVYEERKLMNFLLLKRAIWVELRWNVEKKVAGEDEKINNDGGAWRHMLEKE